MNIFTNLENFDNLPGLCRLTLGDPIPDDPKYCIIISLDFQLSNHRINSILQRSRIINYINSIRHKHPYVRIGVVGIYPDFRLYNLRTFNNLLYRHILKSQKDILREIDFTVSKLRDFSDINKFLNAIIKSHKHNFVIIDSSTNPINFSKLVALDGIIIEDKITQEMTDYFMLTQNKDIFYWKESDMIKLKEATKENPIEIKREVVEKIEPIISEVYKSLGLTTPLFKEVTNAD